MRAGLLREKLTVLTVQSITTESGATHKAYIPSYQIRAAKRKLTASFGDGTQADEEFIANTLVFQTRQYTFLKEKARIQYDNNYYEIILVDKLTDNSCILTLSKINE